MSRSWMAALALTWLLAQGSAHAHPVPFSYLDIRLQPDAIDGTLVVHILDVAHDLVHRASRAPARSGVCGDSVRAQSRGSSASGCKVALDGQGTPVDWLRLEVAPERQSLRLHFRIPSARAPASMRIAGSLFPYDPNHKTFVNMYKGEALTQAILERSKTTFDYFAGTRQGTFAVVRKFLPSGIHHIPDRPGPPAVPGRSAVARGHARTSAAHRDGIYRGAQHHADHWRR